MAQPIPHGVTWVMMTYLFYRNVRLHIFDDLKKNVSGFTVFFFLSNRLVYLEFYFRITFYRFLKSLLFNQMIFCISSNIFWFCISVN